MIPVESEITVVSGLPRSGTSLLMRMLNAAGMHAVTDEQRQADEDNPLGYFELEAVKHLRSDTSWLPSARGKVIKIIHLLLMDLPTTERYRVVFMHRDLDEVVASQAKMLERSGRTGAAISPQLLKDQYKRQLAQVDAWLAARPQFARLDVSYNALLADPGPVVSQIAGFLGLQGHEASMIAAIDPSLYRNRRS